uniref:Uncharacterized protein n=1 Tax=Mycena chlorophos TaxID=658473 RepID=A0ABQ0M2J5_MYCCL|nr:predicted protein [Mycena chlorophos]
MALNTFNYDAEYPIWTVSNPTPSTSTSASSSSRTELLGLQLQQRQQELEMQNDHRSRNGGHSSPSSGGERSPTYYPALNGGPPPQLPYTAAPPMGSTPRYSQGTPYPDLSLSVAPGPTAESLGVEHVQQQSPSDVDPRSPGALEPTVSLSQLLAGSEYAPPDPHPPSRSSRDRGTW